MKDIVALSKGERDRLVVLRQVKQGKLTQRAAAEQLGLSPRWVKKLLARLRLEGDQGLAHRLRAKPSNNGHPAALREQAPALIRERYSDYGPTPASEVPASEHDWLEGRGPKLYLIAMIDDATSVLTRRFALSDSTAENMQLLKRYVELHGRPAAVYTDKAGLFQVNRPLRYNKHLDAEPPPTQIGRALAELDIRRIPAYSPQAKGRIERSFGTLQDRLVKGLRRCQASSLEEANRKLRKDQRLESILSAVEPRVVGNDYTIAWRGKRYQIPAVQAKPRMRKQTVRIEQRLDGGL